nr:hypothetical protein [Tanacetum cinerariifolium]
ESGAASQNVGYPRLCYLHGSHDDRPLYRRLAGQPLGRAPGAALQRRAHWGGAAASGAAAAATRHGPRVCAGRPGRILHDSDAVWAGGAHGGQLRNGSDSRRFDRRLLWFSDGAAGAGAAGTAQDRQKHAVFGFLSSEPIRASRDQPPARWQQPLPAKRGRGVHRFANQPALGPAGERRPRAASPGAGWLSGRLLNYPRNQRPAGGSVFQRRALVEFANYQFAVVESASDYLTLKQFGDDLLELGAQNALYLDMG